MYGRGQSSTMIETSHSFIHDCRQGDLPFPGLRVPIDGCLYDVVPSVNSDVGGEYFNICLGLRLRLQQFCSVQSF